MKRHFLQESNGCFHAHFAIGNGDGKGDVKDDCCHDADHLGKVGLGNCCSGLGRSLGRGLGKCLGTELGSALGSALGSYRGKIHLHPLVTLLYDGLEDGYRFADHDASRCREEDLAFEE